jgi:ParB/RepB/Spo0J family partition protein
MINLAATPVQLIDIDDIDPSPFNPRRRDASAFSEEKLQRLGESLASSTGQLEAILVRPKPGAPGRYELANGERRWRAAQLVGVGALAAKIREMSDAEMVEVALAVGMGDNVESLTILEEAEGYQQLMKLRGFDQRQLAAHLGRPLLQVHRAISLLQLPATAREALQNGELSARTAWLIARIPGESPRTKAAAAIMHSEIHGGVMPTRAAEDYILANICRTLKGAPFDIKSPDLLADAGPCTTCRFRAGNNPDEYGDVGDPLKCMSPDCFEQKLKAHRERVIAKVAVDGRQPLSPEENARVFPTDERGIHYTSDYVAYNERPTPDVLKKEVNPSAAPTWRELVEGGKAEVKIYVGMHQNGHAVELVKRSEAIAAADVNERRIFAETEIKRATQRVERGDSIASADAAAQHEARERDLAAQSRAAQEKAEAEARKKAEKTQRKKDKASRALLVDLWVELIQTDWQGRARWRSLGALSLLYEHLQEQLSSDEVAFLVEALDPEQDPSERTRQGLEDYASCCTLDQMGALVVCMILTPHWRAQGVDGHLPKLWAKEIIAGDPAGVDGPLEGTDKEDEEEKPRSERAAAEIAGRPAQDQRELKEIAKAHSAGMPVLEIARSYGYPVADVCGMLKVPVPADAPELPAHCAPYMVQEIIGYDNEAKTVEEIAYLMHRDQAWVRQVLRACGRNYDAYTPVEVAEADAKLAAAFADVLPGTSASARAAIMAKYAKRVTGEAKAESDLTPPEKLKIVAILRTASAGRKTKNAGTVETAAEKEAA